MEFLKEISDEYKTIIKWLIVVFAMIAGLIGAIIAFAYADVKDSVNAAQDSANAAKGVSFEAKAKVLELENNHLRDQLEIEDQLRQIKAQTIKTAEQIGAPIVADTSSTENRVAARPNLDDPGDPEATVWCITVGRLDVLSVTPGDEPGEPIVYNGRHHETDPCTWFITVYWEDRYKIERVPRERGDCVAPFVRRCGD